MTSAEVLGKFWTQVLKEVEEREPAYGVGWKDDELVWLIQNIRRKARSIELMWERGNYIQDRPKFLEQLRDLASYSGFLHLRLEESKEGDSG